MFFQGIFLNLNKDTITVSEALYLKIMGKDAGLVPAANLSPKTNNLAEWKEYYLFVCFCRRGNMTLDI